jgi:phosphatidylinositol-3-phosphatase
MSLRSLIFAGVFLGVAFCAAAQSPDPNGTLPPVRHVFVLLLENQSYETTFGKQSAAPFLAHKLAGEGALLTQYFGIGHASLDNYVALISGQAPNEATQLDCGTFIDFKPTSATLNADGQLLGVGCVYPPSVKTLPDQLEAAGLSWKAYMEDMGNDPEREAPTCGHAPLNEPDHTHIATPQDGYAAKHNPFIYFHTIIDDRPRCDSHVVNLTQLSQDLSSLAATPNYVFITPNLCNDGHDAHCVDGRRGGLTAINAFLEKWVPQIQKSAAFRADGLLIVTFDESDGGGAEGSSACCGEQPLPGARYQPGFRGPGGGRIGAVVLSPFVKPGTVSNEAYNHYSLLRTIETLFGLAPLGYAGAPNLKTFGADVFTAAAPHPPARSAP